MRTLFHGSRIEVEYPEIRVQKFHKDFFWGFYCTTMEEQAARWSVRFGGADCKAVPGDVGGMAGLYRGLPQWCASQL